MWKDKLYSQPRAFICTQLRRFRLDKRHEIFVFRLCLCTGDFVLFILFANSMIALDTQSFQLSRQSGNVTGVIFLEVEGSAFPERGWSDFPVIILGRWTDAWLQLEMPTRREVQWRF